MSGCIQIQPFNTTPSGLNQIALHPVQVHRGKIWPCSFIFTTHMHIRIIPQNNEVSFQFTVEVSLCDLAKAIRNKGSEK